MVISQFERRKLKREGKRVPLKAEKAPDSGYRQCPTCGFHIPWPWGRMHKHLAKGDRVCCGLIGAFPYEVAKYPGLKLWQTKV